MHSNGINVSENGSIFSFGGTLHPDFHTTYPNLHSSQQGAKGLSQFLGEYVGLSVFLSCSNEGEMVLQL